MMPRPVMVSATVLTVACGSRSGSAADTVSPDSAAIAGSSAAPPACLIDSTSVGGIRLGMTVGEARATLPSARFEYSEAADGVPWIDVIVDTTALMSLYAGDQDAAIDWSAPVDIIQTFNSACATASGLRRGSLVTDVEKLLGPVARILESENESRQFIWFANQPSWMTLRLDYTGIFLEGQRETTRYQADARVFSIAIER